VIAGLKPATAKAHAILKKLEALAERGVDGEKLVAQRKLERLKAMFNFDAGEMAESTDLFRGNFKRSKKGKRIWSFSHTELDIANAIKWAIESGTGISCVYSGQKLLAEAAPETVKRLSEIAVHIGGSFRELLARFNNMNGVSAADRGVFVLGLYDGMMNTPRNVGQALPSRAVSKQKKRGRKPVASAATNLHVHPYTLAFDLGRQIRFSVPLQEIAAQLEGVARQGLPQETAA
jgi:hypothetical protein